MKPYLCIYHGNCADGFTAAWVLRNALGEENVDFVPGFYGKDYQQTLSAANNTRATVEYECIYLVDFSYKRHELLRLASVARRIVIIDHHKTAQEDLVDLPDNVECHFDMEHSGAMLTWMYFNANISVGLDRKLSEVAPALIQRVEDRDLWRFKFSDTREVQANIFSYEYTFENWDKLAATAMEDLRKGGEAIERKHFKDIKEMLTSTQSNMQILGYEVPCANLPYIYSSDAGHVMSADKELGQYEHFAVCYWFTNEGIVFSLRSAENRVDVSEVAKHFGGGGHRHAAGFQLTFQEYWDAIDDDEIIFKFTMGGTS